jgi:ribosomal protein L11 methylase PrmA
LESAIKKLTYKEQDSEWANYYEDTNYSADALGHKKRIVAEFLERIKPKSVWDLGANTGLFSRLASGRKIQTVSFDSDPVAVERNYMECKKNKEAHILPLLLDLTNPSPRIGWGNQERMSLTDRGPVDTVLALALIHHLAISNNIPFEKITQNLKGFCKSLIIEFVPKDDSQIRKILSTREDIFNNYNQTNFEEAFKKQFVIQQNSIISGSQRSIYLMTAKNQE